MHNVQLGDQVECYPFSSKAFWGSGSNFYWSGNCRLTSGGTVVSGVGHFIRTWQGGAGINGAPLPNCYPHTEFEGVFSIVSTGGTVEILDILCSGIPRYQVGGILWFSSDSWVDTGSTEGLAAMTETPQNSGCTNFVISIPTPQGTVTVNLDFSRYYGGGCLGEDGSLSGTVVFGGTAFKILGVMSEFRCTTGYC